MTKGEKAKALFEEGYNCAQAVTLAFADEMGMDRDTAARVSSSFGGGVGRLREICGCVSGMAIVLGELTGYSEPETGEAKKELYERIQTAAGRFREANGSIICRELLDGVNKDSGPAPEARTPEYYAKRPCGCLTASAADILEKLLEEYKKED